MAGRNRRELLVEFKGDTGDLTRAANDSERALTGVGKAASGPGGMLSKLTPVIDPIQLIGQGLQFATTMAMDFAQAAIEDNKSAKALAGVIQNVTGATKAQTKAADDWIAKLQLQVGIADDELRPAFARLVAVSGDVTTAQDLMKVALDAAAGTGKDFNAIVDALGKAQLGNVSGLQRLGIATKDAEGNQLSLGTILDQMKTKWGGLAEEVANEDPLNKASLAWGEMQEKLGNYVLPVLNSVTDWWINKGQPFLEKLWSIVKDKVVPVIRDQLAPAFERLGIALRGSSDGFDDNTDSMSDWRSIAGIVAGLVGAIATGIDLVALKIQNLRSAWDQLWDYAARASRALIGFWNAIDDAAGRVADAIRGAWSGLFDWLRRNWNRTIGRLPFAPDMPELGASSASVPSSALAAVPAAPITLNLPAGTDGHAIVTQLRTYGARIGGLELGAVSRAAVR